MKCEQKRRVKDNTKILGLSNWKVELSLTELGKSREETAGGDGQRSRVEF